MTRVAHSRRSSEMPITPMPKLSKPNIRIFLLDTCIYYFSVKYFSLTLLRYMKTVYWYWLSNLFDFYLIFRWIIDISFDWKLSDRRISEFFLNMQQSCSNLGDFDLGTYRETSEIRSRNCVISNWSLLLAKPLFSLYDFFLKFSNNFYLSFFNSYRNLYAITIFMR